MTPHNLIRQAVEELNIDVPIMTTRVVGDRVEMTLYGGRRVTYHYIDGAGEPQTAELLKKQTVRHLRQLASILEVANYTRMKKTELVATLAQFNETQLARADAEARA